MHEAIKELRRKVKDNLIIIDQTEKTADKYYRDIQKQQEVIKKCHSISKKIRKENKELERAIKWLEEECNEGIKTENVEKLLEKDCV